MNFHYLNNKNKKFYLSLGLSSAAHVIIFFILAFLLGIRINKPVVNPVYLNFTNNAESRDKFKSETEPIEDLNQSEANSPEKIESNRLVPSNFYLFSELDADTSDLQQVYYETTLDVTIRYPGGWTFIDQNVKNRLDGVTFWVANSELKPPPYVHLEVVQKYLFNPARFSDSLKISDFLVYFAAPEELEGQINQLFYIRTDIEEDFSLKLVINGWEAYRNFQPKLLGMLKTFDFKHSLF